MLGLFVLRISFASHPSIAIKQIGKRKRLERRVFVMEFISEAKIEVDPEAPACRIGSELAVALQVVVAGAEVRELRGAAAIWGPPVQVAAAHADLRVRDAVHGAHLRQPRLRDASA